MREILFKGKRKDNKKWIEGFYLIHKESGSESHKILSGLLGRSGNYAKFDVYPETISQYTGLIDKNGVGIFEGDVCVHRFKRIWKTEIHKSTVIFNQPFCSFYLNDGICIHRMRDDIEYEVIGNIHDKPEDNCVTHWRPIEAK